MAAAEAPANEGNERLDIPFWIRPQLRQAIEQSHQPAGWRRGRFHWPFIGQAAA